MHSFMKHSDKMKQTFDDFNSNLYLMADDSDVFPVADQRNDEPVETEKFREKKNYQNALSTRQ